MSYRYGASYSLDRDALLRNHEAASRARLTKPGQERAEMPLAERLVHKGDEAGEGGVGAADDGTRRHLEHGAQRLELRGIQSPGLL